MGTKTEGILNEEHVFPSLHQRFDEFTRNHDLSEVCDVVGIFRDVTGSFSSVGKRAKKAVLNRRRIKGRRKLDIFEKWKAKHSSNPYQNEVERPGLRGSFLIRGLECYCDCFGDIR
ncbi:hypothetical protein TNCV_3032651 [Trichonephila clavipes]|nr:hypothetical protein TNCV_3032651 [Trichonephila clavipes]